MNSETMAQRKAGQLPECVMGLLMVCGIASALLYVGADIAAAVRWDGYSYTAQMVSELMAVEAPTRPFLVALLSVYGLLMFAFGAGLLLSAGTNRALRATGWLVVASTAVGFVTLLFFPMHSRGAVGAMTLTDTMHIALTCVGVLLTLLCMSFGAAALGKRFRLYSIATIVALVVFGALAGLGGPRINANLPTPWLGIAERINIYATMLWLVVLAVALLKATKLDAQPTSITATEGGQS